MIMDEPRVISVAAGLEVVGPMGSADKREVVVVTKMLA